MSLSEIVNFYFLVVQNNVARLDLDRGITKGYNDPSIIIMIIILIIIFKR
jgi:hypothetical protein